MGQQVRRSRLTTDQEAVFARASRSPRVPRRARAKDVTTSPTWNSATASSLDGKAPSPSPPSPASPHASQNARRPGVGVSGWWSVVVIKWRDKSRHKAALTHGVRRAPASRCRRRCVAATPAAAAAPALAVEGQGRLPGQAEEEEGAQAVRARHRRPVLGDGRGDNNNNVIRSIHVFHSTSRHPPTRTHRSMTRASETRRGTGSSATGRRRFSCAE